VAVDDPIGNQGSSMEYESGRDRPLGDTLNRPTFIYERQDGMDGGNKICR
jgi:hypothetical protein